MRVIILIILLFTAKVVSAAPIYKCQVNGKWAFTDKPCAGETVKFDRINTSDPTSITAYASDSWFTDYNGYLQALEVSKKHEAPLFIYFQADWCGYCRKLERELLYTREGKNILGNIVKVVLSPEKGHNEKQLFEQHGGTGYPSVYIKKAHDSSAVKYSFMKKGPNGWFTKPASELKKVLDSL